jgi:Flp pilus assembly protein TadB
VFSPDDFAGKRGDQPTYTPHQKVLISAFITVPALVGIVILAVVFRHQWIWIVGAVLLALVNLGPAFRAARARKTETQ